LFSVRGEQWAAHAGGSMVAVSVAVSVGAMMIEFVMKAVTTLFARRKKTRGAAGLRCW
jgi:uncharacterized membrane protein (DUF485 family)